MATILVVDDRPANRETLGALLGSAHHRVTEAPNGAEALTMVRASQPDLVIADLLMPRIDGYEFVNRLRADTALAAMPVIFTTPSYHRRRAEDLALRCGVTHILIRPIEPEPTLLAVEQALAKIRDPTAAPVSSNGDPEHQRSLTDTLERKVEELESANGRLKALIELGRSHLAERDPRRLLTSYCHAGRELIGTRYAFLGVIEDDGAAFRHWLTSGFVAFEAASVGFPPPGDGLLGRPLAENRPIHVGTVGTELHGVSFLPSDPPVHSMLIVPITMAMKGYGVLGFADKVGGEGFSNEDEGLVVHLAAQLAVGYVNSLRQQETERNAGRLAVEVVERQRSESTLLENEKRFRQLTENIHKVFWLADDEADRILYVSPSFDEIWGRSPGELYANRQGWTDSIHPADRARVIASTRIDGRGQIYDVEYRVVRPDGTERWIRDRSFAVPPEAGSPRRIAGIAEDITELKQDRAKLEQYADRLANLRRIDRAILEVGPPREIAETALHHLRLLIPCWHIGIWMFDLKSGTAEVLAAEGAGMRFFPVGSKVTLAAIGFDDIQDLSETRDRVVTEMFPLPESPIVIRSLHEAGMRSYFRIPLAAQGELIGSLILCADQPGKFGAEHIEFAHEVADQLAICVRHAFLFDEVQTSRERLQTLSRQLLKAQEEERRHIARELHDEIGQSLTAVKIDLQRAMAKVGKSAALACLEESDALIDRILQQVRNLSLDLRPSVLDDLGLVAALRWYLDRVAQRAGFVGRFVADPPAVRSTPDIETACFRAAQEALTNVIRHARAREVHIALKQKKAKLELVIRDDGVGFDVAEARRRAAKGTSLGLLGMQERVTYAGGQIAIQAGPGIGTEIQISFPLLAVLSETSPENEEQAG